MKVLVTGGAGYIGSVLTSHLLQVGHRVRVLDALMFGGESLLGVYDHSDFEFVRADVREAEEVAPALEGVDAVIHLAAIVGEPACRMYAELARTTNLDATISLVDQAKREGVSRFVFTSTCSNYGISDISILAGEEMPLNPISLYSETKVEAEKYVVGAADDTFCASVLRLATAYGLSPRMRFDLLVNELVRDAVSRKWVVLYGPESWRPFVHVKDVARAFETVLEAPGDVISGSTFNVGADSENYQKVQLAELIKKHVPYADMEIMDRKSDQ
jgi:nucleoside-diphosphate-sugar epimerase